MKSNEHIYTRCCCSGIAGEGEEHVLRLLRLFAGFYHGTHIHNNPAKGNAGGNDMTQYADETRLYSDKPTQSYHVRQCPEFVRG